MRIVFGIIFAQYQKEKQAQENWIVLFTIFISNNHILLNSFSQKT